MRTLGAAGLLTLALAALPCVAQPQVATTSKDAHLRAGPARDYPVIAVLAAGTVVSVQGCLTDYSWCDVVAGPSRGWVYAANLDYAYQGGHVPIRSYGAQIGIAVIGFMLFDYWTDHYRERPFYRDRDRWARRPRPPRGAGPGVAPPAPPRQVVPGVRPPAPPAPGAPGRPQPKPAPHGSPGAQHPPPPQHGSPGAQRPPPPRHDQRPGPRPAPSRPDKPGGPRP